MSRAQLGNQEPVFDGIDLDRVIVDPDYRRRVIDRLRAEAATRPTAGEDEPDSSSGVDD
jgi:hypothetical protein